MPPRTWLTTPPGERPVTDERGADDEEHYVPALQPPREPRVPGRFRRVWIGIGLVVAVLLGAVALVLIGESAQQEDPSVPDIPGIEDPTMDEPEDDALPQ